MLVIEADPIPFYEVAPYLLMIIGGGILFYHGTIYFTSFFQNKSHFIPTQATITGFLMGTYRTRKYSRSYPSEKQIALVSYCVNEVEYTTRYNKPPSSLEVGSTIEILYNPFNPNQVSLKEDVASESRKILAILGGGLFILGLLWMLYNQFS